MEAWRVRPGAAEERWLRPTRLKVALIFGLVLLGIRGLLAAIAAFMLMTAMSDPARWQQLALTTWADGNLFGTTRLFLVAIVLILEAVISVLLLIAVSLMITGRLRRGLMLGYWILLFSLTAVHLLMFYFNQFDVIATTLLQFSLLFGIVRYRSRYLDSGHRVN